MEYGPFNKRQLALRDQLEGLMWREFGYVMMPRSTCGGRGIPRAQVPRPRNEVGWVERAVPRSWFPRCWGDGESGAVCIHGFFEKRHCVKLLPLRSEAAPRDRGAARHPRREGR